MDELTIKEYLKEYKGWNYEDGFLTKTFTFKNFVDSIDFINDLTPIAEKSEHHPDLIVKYNKVTIKLRTHDQNSVTEKDFELASKIERL